MASVGAEVLPADARPRLAADRRLLSDSSSRARQAMNSTATALTSAKVSAGAGPVINQMAKVGDRDGDDSEYEVAADRVGEPITRSC